MPRTILIVEDNDDDAFFLQRAFKKAGVVRPLPRVDDGQKAIEYLSGAGDYADRLKHPFPCAVLLDIKLPKRNGFEVLAWVREKCGCPRLPVLMFSSSGLEDDVEKAYELGANGYIKKPGQAEDLEDFAMLVKRFWIDANIPPTGIKDRKTSTEPRPGRLNSLILW